MLRPAALTLAVTLACACLLPATVSAAGQAAPAAPAAPAAAAAPETPIVLRVDDGSVMVSDGGAFAPAATGTVLQPGDRLMVADGGVATVFVDDSCYVTYDTPGVHVVTRECARVGSPVPTGATVGIIAGVVVLGALAAGGGGGGDDTPPPPPPPPPPVSR